MPTDDVFEIAVRAVTRLVDDRGEDATFPFDAVWLYTTGGEDVPSGSRPSQSNRLRQSGYLELTGGFTKAEAPSRAGSPTREYQAGPKLRSGQGPKSHPSSMVADALRDMERSMAAQGFVITSAELANFYLALLTSPLVIMTGVSGTGKSRVPRMFAEMIGAHFASIPVKPQWDDNADLFGYTSNLNQGAFVKGEVTAELEIAATELGTPWFLLLDEMNLAAVEHYFSDFLSVMETRRRSGDAVITDRLPIDLPSVSGDAEDPHEHLRSLYLPHNVRVIGTANMDETTRSFSPKVLDRAFSIEFNDVDLTAFPAAPEEPVHSASAGELARRLVDQNNPVTVHEVYLDLRELCDEVAGLMESIKTILEPAGLSFGYRPRDASCLYLWHWNKDGLDAVLPREAALDLCILQKVLPKIHGQSERLHGCLENLEAWLQGESAADLDADPSRRFLRSAAKVKRMRERLEDDGTTSYWDI